MVCKICGLVIGDNSHLSIHVSKKHSISYKEYYDKYIDNSDHKCPFCDNQRKWHNGNYFSTCGSKECKCKSRSFSYKSKFVKGSEAYKDLYMRKAKTCLAKYGVSHQSKAKTVIDKTRQTFLDHYGVDNPNKTKEVRDKIEKTCLERYGVINGGGAVSAQEKIKNTLLEHYGVEHALQCKELLEKAKATMLERYGVENCSQSPELSKNKRHSFSGPNGILFRSKAEVEVAEFCEANLLEWKYEPTSIEYIDSLGNKHRYIPDFEIEGKLYEVKGPHLWKDGKLLHTYSKNDPYSYDTKEEILKAKSKCMKDNHVVVILSNELDKLEQLLGVKSNDYSRKDSKIEG